MRRGQSVGGVSRRLCSSRQSDVPRQCDVQLPRDVSHGAESHRTLPTRHMLYQLREGPGMCVCVGVLVIIISGG